MVATNGIAKDEPTNPMIVPVGVDSLVLVNNISQVAVVTEMGDGTIRRNRTINDDMVEILDGIIVHGLSDNLVTRLAKVQDDHELYDDARGLVDTAFDLDATP